MTKTICTAIALIAIFATVTYSAHAQERTDAAMPVFIKKSEPLTKAKGYFQNETSGKWIENDNLLKDFVVAPTDSGNRGTTAQNLIWFRSATLSFASKKYYVFYYYFLTGQYKYPETRVDWVSNPATKFIIVDSAQYFTFKKAVLQKKGETVKLKTIISDVYAIDGEYDETRILGEMAKVLKDKYLFNDYCFTANTQTVNGKDVARFSLPQACIFSKYLSTRYFEISYDDFKKLFVE